MCYQQHIAAMESTSVAVLLLFSITASSVVSSNRRYVLGNKIVDRNGTSSTVHNVTVDCGKKPILEKTAWWCLRDLLHLVNNGYPWSPRGSQKNSTNHETVADRTETLRDALDSLDHVCYIHDRSRTCLEQSGISDNCLIAEISYAKYQTEFQFICHHMQRDENLARSLQCLHDTRVMVMLYFHIADRCRGMGILDDIMTRNKNAYFYELNITPLWYQPAFPTLYCLPKSVIFTCIRHIIEEQCGAMTADFVQNYLFFLQDLYDKAMKSVGLSSKICDYDITSGMLRNTPHRPSGQAKSGFPRLLEMTAPGTALETLWGKRIMSYLHNVSETDICTTVNAQTAYLACTMSSDDAFVKSKFNILQFAHKIYPSIYNGAQCNRLEQFTSCWNLLHGICGPKVRGLEQAVTLLVEGCKIQSELDAGCQWQDMLLPHYIQASRVTVWPIESQCLINPLLLEGSQFSSFNSLMDDLDTVISLLQPGVEEISRKCAPKSAELLRLLLKKLRYQQRDGLKYSNILLKVLMPK